MSAELDELFGEGGGQPEPQSRHVLAVLAAGVSLSVVGLACSAVPGGLLVLWSHYLANKEVDRVRSGYLPADAAPEVRRLQRVTLAALVLVLVVFAVQTWLLSTGFYDMLWTAMIQQAAAALGATPAESVTP